MPRQEKASGGEAETLGTIQAGYERLKNIVAMGKVAGLLGVVTMAAAELQLELTHSGFSSGVFWTGALLAGSGYGAAWVYQGDVNTYEETHGNELILDAKIVEIPDRDIPAEYKERTQLFDQDNPETGN